MQELEIDDKIEKESQKKKYNEPQMQIMGKMNRLTKANKDASNLDIVTPAPPPGYP